MLFITESFGNFKDILRNPDKHKGKLNGTTTSNTLIGKQVTLPDVDAKYIK